MSRGDWNSKWGRHYLPSLQRAHELQQSNNFKVRMSSVVMRLATQLFDVVIGWLLKLFLSDVPFSCACFSVQPQSRTKIRYRHWHAYVRTHTLTHALTRSLTLILTHTRSHSPTHTGPRNPILWWAQLLDFSRCGR